MTDLLSFRLKVCAQTAHWQKELPEAGTCWNSHASFLCWCGPCRLEGHGCELVRSRSNSAHSRAETYLPAFTLRRNKKSAGCSGRRFEKGSAFRAISTMNDSRGNFASYDALYECASRR